MANKIIPGLGVHHIALKACDYEKSLTFYKGLGMTEHSFWGEGDSRVCLLDIGDGVCLELFANGSDEYSVMGKYAHLALCTDDVDGAFERALSLGASVYMEPQTVPLGTGDNAFVARVAFVNGPDGELIEFFCEVQDGEKTKG